MSAEVDKFSYYERFKKERIGDVKACEFSRGRRLLLFSGDLIENGKCGEYFFTFFRVNSFHKLIHPAVALPRSVFNQVPAFFGQRDLLGTAIIGIFSALDQTVLKELVHQLAGGRGGDVEAFADVGYAAIMVMVQLHQDPELGHRKTCSPGK